MKTKLTLSIAAIGFLFSNASAQIPQAQKPVKAEAWASGFANWELKPLVRQEPVVFRNMPPKPGVMPVMVHLNDLETIEGWGANVTEASVLSIQMLPKEKQDELMVRLFDKKKGAGLSYLRMPLGASDFIDRTKDFYTYDDSPNNEPDPEFKHFNIDRDLKSIEFIKKAKAINPDIKVMLTPWSAPAWMKTGNEGLKLGRLAPEHAPSFARYFAKTIKEFKARGLDIDAISVLNEPFFEGNYWYISMEMNAQEQADFIGKHLGPELRRQGLHTKILALDHNYDLDQKAIEILSNAEANQYISGVSFHCYGGQPAMMQNVRKAFPDRPIYQMECTTLEDGNPNKGFFDDWLTYIMLQEGLRVSLAWNLALPPGAKRPTGLDEACKDCSGIVEINPDQGTFRLTPEYWAFAQMSRFIDSGAKEAKLTFPKTDNFDGRAFRNPNGSIVVVLNNRSDNAIKIQLREKSSGSALYTVPAKTAVTYRWTTK